MLKHLIAIALLLPASIAQARSIPDPVVTACPRRQADLQFGLYSMMTAAKFQPLGGSSSWRRRVDGPFHGPSFEAARYLHVDFVTFQTSQGTRIVAQLRWRTSVYEFGVEQASIVDGFQQALDGVAGQFPC